MSEQPEERNKDTKNTSKNKIEKPKPEPVDKQDPTEPVSVESGSGSLTGGGKASGGTRGL